MGHKRKNLRSLLIGVKLSFNEAPNVRLVGVGEASDTTRRLASAVTNLGATAKATVVARALVFAIQPLCAVGDTTGPLAADCPLAGAGHLVAEVAGCLDVIIDAHGHCVEGEDLVVVSIEKQVPHASTPVTPGCHTLEGIVEGNSDVRVSQITPTVHVELTNSVHVEVRAKGLVQELNGRDCGVRRMVVADLVENLDGVVDRVALSPCNVAVFT